MALHPNFPKSPHAILDPDKRWFPAEEDIRGEEADKLMPPLVAMLRREVKQFRDSGYVGATDTSKHLLNWWFNTEHIVHDGDVARKFEYYFAQREALETIIWLIDVSGVRDHIDLIRYDSTGRVYPDLFSETWRRYVIKMATGSGKTKVMSLALAWSFFHKLYEADSPMARNFLIIAPNIIVLDRLARDFEGLRIFSEDPVLPDNGFEGKSWQDDFQLTLHRQDDVKASSSTGNIFLTNIHRVYDSDSKPPSADDDDTRDYFLGKKPTGETTDSKVELDQIVRDIDELMVINDEAHHVHNKDLAWFKSIQDIHNQLLQKNKKLSLQLDVTATPKHNDGTIFVQTVADYPLVEAIAQDIVKHPVVPDEASQAKLSEKISDTFTEKFREYIDLGVVEWRKVYEDLRKVGKKSILFVMVDNTKNCDEVAKYLQNRYPDFEGKDSVLTIHTKKNGEISESNSSKKSDELEKLRKLANEIDDEKSPYLAIVSVMMLKEGWDVRNVTTIVGLRAYVALSNILPEQTLGRGLRRMFPDQSLNEYVSVVGTPKFMEFVESIQAEGVELERKAMGAGAQSAGPMVIEVDFKNEKKSIAELDIELPVLTPRLYRRYENLGDLDVELILTTPRKIKQFTKDAKRTIKFSYVVVMDADKSFHHETTLDSAGIIDYRGVVRYFTMMIMQELRLFSGYDILYGKVKHFVAEHLFGKEVDLEDENIIRNLSDIAVTEAVIRNFKSAINKLIVTDTDEVDITKTIKLSDTKSFVAKTQEYTLPSKSVFNKIVGDSVFELEFASFLENCDDVQSFAKNYTQIYFKLDYPATDESIRNYHPDFFVRTTDGEVVIVETKGMVDIDVPKKMARLKQWCEDVAKTDSLVKPWFVYVDYIPFKKHQAKLKTFSQIREVFTQYQD